MNELETRLENQAKSIEMLKVENKRLANEKSFIANELAYRESCFVEMFKNAYFEYKEMIDNFGFVDEYTKRCGRVVTTMEEIAKKVFGYNDKKVEDIEDTWYSEWNKKNEWKYR